MDTDDSSTDGSGWSSSDDSDIDDLLQDDDAEMMVVVLAVQELEDERGLNLPCFYDNVGTRVRPERNPNRLQGFLQPHREIENANTHNQLRDDLVEHH